MIEINKKLVKDEYKDIPESFITDREMISKKKQLAAMGEYGQLGNPAVANKEVGELLNQDVSEFIIEAVKNL